MTLQNLAMLAFVAGSTASFLLGDWGGWGGSSADVARVMKPLGTGTSTGIYAGQHGTTTGCEYVANIINYHQ